MNQEKYDQDIRRIAQSGSIPFPMDFYERMKQLYDSLLEDKERTLTQEERMISQDVNKKVECTEGAVFRAI